jgi:hypothetical protein
MEVGTTNKGMIILEITPKSCGQGKMAGQLVCGVKDASAKFKQRKIDNRFTFNN